MSRAFHLKVDPEGIGHLVFDLPEEKINKLSKPVLEELDSLIEGLKDNQHVKALVITSAKDGVFIAGADIKSFESYFRDASQATKIIGYGHDVFRKMEKLPFPTIAVINGVCLGGGLEFALSCTYRVVGDSPKTSLGLPEVNLGIYPGWGGTQRLPRLIGLTQGLTMILSGKAANAKKAYKIKLADAIVASEFIEDKTAEFVHRCLTKEGKAQILKRRKQTGLYSLFLEKNPLGRALLYWMTKRNILKKTKGFYPSPLAALEVIKKSYPLSLDKGLKKERNGFKRSIEKGDFRYLFNLLHIFFNTEAMKKNPGLPEGAHEPKTIRSAGVLGAGTMGSGIAWLMSYKDISVRMKDINWDAVGKGMASAWDTYKTLMKIRKLKPTQANVKFHNIAPTVDYTGFEKLDFVLEAAVENLELKHKIFKELEEKIRPDTILATNTSSLTVEELSSALKHPERLVGMHFFNPPARMPLVEVVAGKKTSPEVVAAAVELCRRLKKHPIVVKDCHGFLVNRIFIRAFSEILRLLEEGVEMERLDQLWKTFGMPMAPFVLADEVGNDVNLKATKVMEKAYGDRMKVSPILEKINEQKLFGKKVGKGFYIHEKKSRKPNPEIKELLGTKQSKEKLSSEEIVDRILLAMLQEASLCLEEEIVKEPGYLDMALVYGMGFPPFRGGLLKYADSIGIDTIVSKMKRLHMVHGERYAPTAQLIDMDKRHKNFFSSP